MFSYEYCKIFENNYFKEHLRKAFMPATLLKSDSKTGVFVRMLQNF